MSQAKPNTTGGQQGEDMSKRSYMRWDAPGIEDIPSDEEENIRRVIDRINQSQRRVFDKARHCYTATHCRTQGIVKGQFIVDDNLPPHLSQSELFQQGGTFPAVCRYSTEPGDPGIDDRIAQPRGFAMKLFNVHGDMFEAGHGIPTQDIEFNSTPVIELADVRTTREIFDLRICHADDPDTLQHKLQQRSDAELQTARDKVPNVHMASIVFYSQSAYRFGDHVIKYRLAPSTDMQEKLAEVHIPSKEEASQDGDSLGSGVHHEWLSSFHKQHEAVYVFQVQLLEDLEAQPVEYAGTEWDESRFPWQTVARLVIPQQESWNMKRKVFWEDHMRLDPWHGLVKLQPLGGANRLRRALYPESSRFRREMNDKQEIHVKSIDEIPE